MQKHIFSAIKYVATHLSEGALQQLGAVAVAAVLAKLAGVW